MRQIAERNCLKGIVAIVHIDRVVALLDLQSWQICCPEIYLLAGSINGAPIDRMLEGALDTEKADNS